MDIPSSDSEGKTLVHDTNDVDVVFARPSTFLNTNTTNSLPDIERLEVLFSDTLITDLRTQIDDISTTSAGPLSSTPLALTVSGQRSSVDLNSRGKEDREIRVLHRQTQLSKLSQFCASALGNIKITDICELSTEGLTPVPSPVPTPVSNPEIHERSKTTSQTSETDDKDFLDTWEIDGIGSKDFLWMGGIVGDEINELLKPFKSRLDSSSQEIPVHPNYHKIPVDHIPLVPIRGREHFYNWKPVNDPQVVRKKMERYEIYLAKYPHLVKLTIDDFKFNPATVHFYMNKAQEWDSLIRNETLMPSLTPQPKLVSSNSSKGKCPFRSRGVLSGPKANPFNENPQQLNGQGKKKAGGIGGSYSRPRNAPGQVQVPVSQVQVPPGLTQVPWILEDTKKTSTASTTPFPKAKSKSIDKTRFLDRPDPSEKVIKILETQLLKNFAQKIFKETPKEKTKALEKEPEKNVEKIIAHEKSKKTIKTDVPKNPVTGPTENPEIKKVVFDLRKSYESARAKVKEEIERNRWEKQSRKKARRTKILEFL